MAIPTKPQRDGDQPMPTPNAHPAVWPIVMQDMQSRHELGIKRYGTPLQPHNGRALAAAIEESLELPNDCDLATRMNPQPTAKKLEAERTIP